MPSEPLRASRLALLGGSLGTASAGMALAGAAGAMLRVLPPVGGLLLFLVGVGIGSVALLPALLGLFGAQASPDAAGRSAALRGTLLSLGVVSWAAAGAARGCGLPRVADVTTSTDDPPAFVAAAAANPGRDLSYPPQLAALQQQAWPDLATLVVPDAPDAAYDRVRAAVATLPRLEFAGESRLEGRIEATQETVVFHLVDDLVVRIRPFQGEGSRVDIRSRARDGKVDFGRNAERLRDLAVRIQAAGPLAAE